MHIEQCAKHLAILAVLVLCIVELPTSSSDLIRQDGSENLFLDHPANQKRPSALFASTSDVSEGVVHPLRLDLDYSHATDGWENVVDVAAMEGAASLLEDFLMVTVKPHPARKFAGVRALACSPTNSNVNVNVSAIPAGTLKIFVYAYQDPFMSDCGQGTLAYAFICGHEIVQRIGTADGEENLVFPLVSAINVCPNNGASKDHPFSSYILRRNTALHEIIHAMGMGFQLTMSRIMKPFAAGINMQMVYSKELSDMAAYHYKCSSLKQSGVPLVGGHLDPYFVGLNDIMGPCVSEKSILSFWTLALLQSLGFYAVNVEGVRNQLLNEVNHTLRVKDLQMPVASLCYGVGLGCSFSVSVCYEAMQITGIGCNTMCLFSGDYVVLPISSDSAMYSPYSNFAESLDETNECLGENSGWDSAYDYYDRMPLLSTGNGTGGGDDDEVRPRVGLLLVQRGTQVQRLVA